VNILISGSSGFIGTHLLSALHGENVFRLGRGSINRSQQIDITWEDIDLKWLNEKKINTIIHLTGIAHDVSGRYKANDYEGANFGLTRKLYDLFLSADTTGKFIFISSVKALADTLNGVLVEECNPNPITPYGRSKWKAEQYIKENAVGDKNYYILRPALVYGPGNKGNLNSLQKLIRSGFPLPLGAFRNKRSFLSVNNLCFIIGKLITEPIPLGAYNCSDGRDLSTNELIRLIGKGLGKKPTIWNLNTELMALLAKMGSIAHLPYNRDTFKKLTENYRVSNEKILKAMKVEAMPYNTEEEIMKTVVSP